MMIDIVFCCRNDNCNGDFDSRAETALRHNEELLRTLGVPHAWICVEWNSFEDRPLFAARARQWLESFRCYVVPPSLHNQYARNPALGMLQFIAKNVGIRRAQAPWVLATNADTLFSRPLAEALRTIGVSPRLMGGHVNGRAGLIPAIADIKSALPHETEALPIGEADQDAVFLAPRVDFEGASLPPANGRGERELDNLAQVSVTEVEPPMRFGAAGDFILARADTWRRLGGFFQGIRFSNTTIDILFCRQALARGHSVSALPPVYHARHADGCLAMPRDGQPRPHHHGIIFSEQHAHIPYRNDDSWGLSEFGESQTPEGFAMLVHPDAAAFPAPAPLEIPPALAGVESFVDELMSAGRELSDGRKVALYGFGAEARKLRGQGAFQELNIVGCLEDSPSAAGEIPYPALSWERLSQTPCDAILIGSSWWRYDLAEKAIAAGWGDRLYPRILRVLKKFS